MYPYFPILFIFISTWLMGNSVYLLIKKTSKRYSIFSWHHFFLLLIVYLLLIAGFFVVYLGLELAGFTSIKMHHQPNQEQLVGLPYLGNLLYFSTITILTVGYGDITPVGWAKLIAALQGLIGYLLPAAFVVSGITSTMKSNDRET